MAITQAQIDALIQFIDETEAAESITNVIVANILQFLNDKIKDIELTKATVGDLATETEDRTAAIALLQQHINWIVDRINELATNGGGLSPEDIINGTTSTAADKALAASQGYVLRREMEKLLSALSNSAFTSVRPVFDWGTPVTYGITQTLENCTSDFDGNTINGNSGQTIVLTPKYGHILELSSVTVSVAGGGTATKERNSSTGVVTITIPIVTGSVTIIASARPANQYRVTVYANNCKSSDPGGFYAEGGSFTTVLTADNGYTLNGVIPEVIMGGVDISNSVWIAGERKIHIPELTSDVVITATAEVSTNHAVSLDLTGVSATSDIDLNDGVEDGDPLSITLSKDTQSDVWALLRPMKACDIIVYMDGEVLEQETDYTITQSANDADITLNIAAVTGDLVIMNVVWKHMYVFYADNSNLGYIGGEVGGTAQRSAHSNNFIPIPNSCMQLAVKGVNDTITDQYRWGCAVYDAGRAYVNGAYLNNSEVAVSLLENGVRNNAKYIRTSAWLNFGNTESTESYAYRIDLCYIYDVTNDKFIWCGKDVDKEEVRGNH